MIVDLGKSGVPGVRGREQKREMIQEAETFPGTGERDARTLWEQKAFMRNRVKIENQAKSLDYYDFGVKRSRLSSLVSTREQDGTKGIWTR